MKRFSLFLLFFSFLFNSSYGFDSEQRYTIETKIGASKQDVHFRTAVANSILDWSTDTVDYGIDLKVNIYENFFTNIEYTYSEVKAGNSTDDDVENGFNSFSWHGVNGRGNDIRASLAYKTIINNDLSFIPLAGLFYKEFEVSTENGFGDYNGTIIDFTGLNPGNQTNSKYIGLSIGGQTEYRFSKRVKASLRAEYLVPHSYEAKNIWYGRTPTLHWGLENSEDGKKGDHGLRIKFDIGFNRTGFIDSIKLYGYYELIQIDGLVEINDAIIVRDVNTGEVTTGKVDGRECLDCLSIGKARFEAFGGGISLQF